MKIPVFINSASNIADFIASVVITLLMTPIYLNSLGKHDYGIWELIAILIGYMGLLDLGLRSAVVRYCSVYLSKNDTEQTRRLYATALLYMSFMGLICFLLCWAWSILGTEALSPSGKIEPKYSELLIWVGLSVFLAFVRNTSEGMIEGSQRYLIKNFLNLIIKTGIAAYLWTFLDEQSGILLLIKVTVVGTALRILTYNVLLMIGTPAITPFASPTIKTFIQLIKFGSKSLINGIAYTIHNSSGTFLVGFLIAPAAVPLYSIPKSIVNYIYSFIETASNVLTPYFVELDKNNKKNEVVETYIFYSKVLVWFLTTAAIFIIVFGYQFISLWLPGQFDENTIQLLLYILIFNVVIERINPLALKLSSAKNKHAFFAKVRPFAAMLTLALSYILIVYFGVIGACIATSLTAMIFTPLFARHSFSLISLSFRKYWSESLRPNLATGVVLFSLAFLIDNQVDVDDFGIFIAIFCLFTFVSLISLTTFTLSKQERTSCVNALLSVLSREK